MWLHCIKSWVMIHSQSNVCFWFDLHNICQMNSKFRLIFIVKFLIPYFQSKSLFSKEILMLWSNPTYPNFATTSIRSTRLITHPPNQWCTEIFVPVIMLKNIHWKVVLVWQRKPSPSPFQDAFIMEQFLLTRKPCQWIRSSSSPNTKVNQLNFSGEHGGRWSTFIGWRRFSVVANCF